MDKERFEAILAIILANLVDEFTGLAHGLKDEGAHLQDVSDFCGFGGTLLAGANVDSGELDEFNREFATLYKVEGGSPSIQKCAAQIAEREDAERKKQAALEKLTLADRQLLGLT